VKKKIEKSNPDRSPIAAQTDEFKLIARAELFPDPDQPRKTFDEASLKELADSIAQQGIVQPLIVRLVKAQFQIREPDLESNDYRLMKSNGTEWVQCDACDEKNIKHLREVWAGNFGGMGLLDDYQDRYMIVAGERRWRASELAGLTLLPCIVRDLDAHKVFAQQFIENEQRVNISALEEAEALTKQLEVRKLHAAAEDKSFSVEDLAKELGMSRAGLYQRLALTRLHAPVREALLAGKISTSVASVVAIVPLPAQQEKLLKQITNEDDWEFPFSVRDVQEIVDDEFCKQLSSAPFKLDDDNVFSGFGAGGFAQLPEPIYVAACKGCPHRTGNLVEQFPELAKKPNVCTRPDCFAAKCKAHWLAKSQDLAQRGATVLTEKEFRKVSKDYLDAEQPTHYSLFDNKYDSAAKVLGKHAPEPVIVSTAEGLKKYYKRVDIPEAAKKAKVKLASRAKEKTETPAEKAKREEKEKEQAAVAERRRAFVLTKIPDLMKALAKLKSAAAWALGVELVKCHDGYCNDDIEEAAEKAKDDQARVLGFLFADNDNHPLGYGGDWDEHGVKLWKQVGIDLVKEFEASENADQKTLALPKAEPQQGKLGLKARIAAAQKARWGKVKASAKKKAA